MKQPFYCWTGDSSKIVFTFIWYSTVHCWARFFCVSNAQALYSKTAFKVEIEFHVTLKSLRISWIQAGWQCSCKTNMNDNSNNTLSTAQKCFIWSPLWGHRNAAFFSRVNQKLHNGINYDIGSDGAQSVAQPQLFIGSFSSNWLNNQCGTPVAGTMFLTESLSSVQHIITLKNP